MKCCCQKLKLKIARPCDNFKDWKYNIKLLLLLLTMCVTLVIDEN